MNHLILFLTLSLISMQMRAQQQLQWRQAGVLPATEGKQLGFAGPVAGISGNALFVGGGANFPAALPWEGGEKKYYDDLFLYRKDEHDSLILFKTAKLPLPLAYAACVSTSRGVVVAGGENAEGAVSAVFLLNYDDRTDEVQMSCLPALPLPLSNAGIAEQDGRIYLAGGETSGETTDIFLTLDLQKEDAVWEVLPSLPVAASHLVLVADTVGGNAFIYSMGGRRKNQGKPSTFYADVFRFEVCDREWIREPSLPRPLSAGTGIAAGKHRIFLFGGDAGETFHKTETLILAIAGEENETIKKGLVEEKSRVQAGHPGFSREVLEFDTGKKSWRVAGNIPFPAPVTTTAVKWGDDILIPGGEIRAGVRTPKIISLKLQSE